jgi:hypothetical protein
MPWNIATPGAVRRGSARYPFAKSYRRKNAGGCSEILHSAENVRTACTQQPISWIFSYAIASHRGRLPSNIFILGGVSTRPPRTAPKPPWANMLTNSQGLATLSAVICGRSLKDRSAIGGVPPLTPQQASKKFRRIGTPTFCGLLFLPCNGIRITRPPNHWTIDRRRFHCTR